MAAGHGWGGASRTGFQPPRVDSRQRFPSLSKETSEVLCQGVKTQKIHHFSTGTDSGCFWLADPGRQSLNLSP